MTVTAVPLVSAAHESGEAKLVAAVSATGTPRTVIVRVGQVPVTVLITSLPSTNNPSATATLPSANVDHPCVDAQLAMVDESAADAIDRSALVCATGAAAFSWRGEGPAGDRRVRSEHPAATAAESTTARYELRLFVT